MSVLTVFRLSPVCLKAYFDFDRGHRHDLTRRMSTHTIRYSGASHLVRAAHDVRAHFRQADVVKLSLLHHLAVHLRVMLDLVLRVESRRLEQIESLYCPLTGPILMFSSSL